MDVAGKRATVPPVQSNHAVVFVRGELPGLPLAIERAGRAAMKPRFFFASRLQHYIDKI